MRGSGGGSRADITQMTEQTRLILWTRRRVEEQRLFYTVLGGGGRFSGQLGERNKVLTIDVYALISSIKARLQRIVLMGPFQRSRYTISWQKRSPLRSHILASPNGNVAFVI